jgi:hypothetical protein
MGACRARCGCGGPDKVGIRSVAVPDWRGRRAAGVGTTDKVGIRSMAVPPYHPPLSTCPPLPLTTRLSTKKNPKKFEKIA